MASPPATSMSAPIVGHELERTLSGSVLSAVVEAAKEQSIQLPAVSNDYLMKALRPTQEQQFANDIDDARAEAELMRSFGRLVSDRIPDGSYHVLSKLRNCLHDPMLWEAVAKRASPPPFSDEVQKMLRDHSIAANGGNGKGNMQLTPVFVRLILRRYGLEQGDGPMEEWLWGAFKDIITAGEEAYITTLVSAGPVKRKLQYRRPDILQNRFDKITQEKKTTSRRAVEELLPDVKSKGNEIAQKARLMKTLNTKEHKRSQTTDATSSSAHKANVLTDHNAIGSSTSEVTVTETKALPRLVFVPRVDIEDGKKSRVVFTNRKAASSSNI
ncbi:hypothetical protein PsYK624_156550 [Phanerochaete sordida]|uniref:Uncharacterized protein n=1 Tax=Phanerochaete sordida TaxID=48140 RepID=A0A9P3LLH5_9APHY|nr:hypothetical protein PsYK624_156550 [Phanerochaete sordida]